jgi:exoribonuclease-2
MNVLFEDDGQLKAGSVLADNDASLQVEAVSGKRLKIKSGAVLLRFAALSAGALMAEGQGLAKELDPDFLWEAIGDGEFGFEDLAREYYGAHPTPAQAAAVAMLLHASPMYFYKKGKGRYRKAPPESLRAALASVERKQREAAQIAGWVGELAARRLPAEFAPKLAMLLYKPDKNSLEWKALAAACDAERTNPVDLLAACGAIPSTHDFHFNRFLSEVFPAGIAFPDWGALPAAPDLPRADVRAFSIDDATTTEIDDAFSMRELANGNVEIGIHIACPGAGHTAWQRARRDRARTAVDRVHARAQADDAAGSGGGRLYVEGRRGGAGTFAVHRNRPRGRAGGACHASESCSGRCESESCDAFGRVRKSVAGAGGPAVDARNARAVEAGAASFGAPRQGRFQSHRLQL